MNNSTDLKAGPEARELIEFLGLEPLPGEGGYFRRTYCAPEVLGSDVLPPGYDGPHPLGTAILYLITPETYSALHRLPTDEIYHFYLGDPVRMLQLYPDGSSRVITLGPDLLGGQAVQAIVPRSVWQASWLARGGRYALLGTTMAPGFEWRDLELGEVDKLTAEYPDRAALIRNLQPR